MSAAQDPARRTELRALGLGDDARRSSSYRAPAPIAEAPHPDNHRAGAQNESPPVRPLRRRGQRRRGRRRRRSWWQRWQRQRRRKKKRQRRSRRASIQKPRPPKDKGCTEAAAVALGSPHLQSSQSPLPGSRKSRRRKPQQRRRRVRIMDLENFMANNLLLKARQGGCTPASRSPRR